MTTKEEREEFSIKIENRVKEHHVSFMEAIVDHCEETGLEIEIAATLLNKTIKLKIEEEAKLLKCLSLKKPKKKSKKKSKKKA
jgi:hypothetical protein